MAHNKLYRNFIILQEDERGYSHANEKALSGYAKIEAKGDKCKISFYAQNLRQEDNYSMVLICNKRDLRQLIDIGSLAINEVGKGDTSKEYYVNNIAGLGISYEKVSGAAICRVKDNENEFIMHGFMNGEDSADNWRKFKYIKADSKKYIGKSDAENVKKDIYNTDVANKTTMSQVSDTSIKASDIVERKKDEDSILSKGNIELGKSNNNSSIQETENRIPESYTNIYETKDDFSEDRKKKCMESKKDKKDEKCDKCDKLDGYDYYEKSENVEETITKLAMKLETYDGSVDMEVYHHMYKDVIIYGFIKDKNDYNCKWKKFKIEKKCKGKKDPSYNYIQNYKRIEENFELDKLNEIDDSDRKDIIDFDKYESGIKKIKPASTTTETMGTGTGYMTPPPAPMMTPPPPAPMMMTPPPAPMAPPPAPMMMTPPPAPMAPPPAPKPPMETTWKPWPEYEGSKTGKCPENVKPSAPNCFGQLDLSDGEPESLNKKQPIISNQINIKGSIGKYFEKIAEGFAPFLGKLIDINYCKWYKIDVNGIEDLSDESNYNQYTLAYYPMLNYYPYISKVGHFLLGYKCNKDGDMQYIIYAIPGSKAKSDQPYGGRTGFVTWTSDNKSGKGYWLMFYDFKNSSIVIPTK
ncbi:hypothetical protein [Clostridium sp. BL-8]|uniref:hypothetical protein n=1 Tax=Clostridium sp. BL-8 TaxID=349938 RepID=UPI00098CB7C4|nr:hypothetical protein [Clostridium sp. BL-8]OOM75317.1 hypothetical protein CLOBL_40430 [Clostridium sp. BL-8]